MKKLLLCALTLNAASLFAAPANPQASGALQPKPLAEVLDGNEDETVVGYAHVLGVTVESPGTLTSNVDLTDQQQLQRDLNDCAELGPYQLEGFTGRGHAYKTQCLRSAIEGSNLQVNWYPAAEVGQNISAFVQAHE